MCTTSIYDARNNFSNLVALAESGEPVELTRYNKPVAVIISYDEYCKTEKRSLLDQLDELKKQYADVLGDERIPLRPKIYPDSVRVIFEE